MVWRGIPAETDRNKVVITRIGYLTIKISRSRAHFRNTAL
jgi:hypothetical protein